MAYNHYVYIVTKEVCGASMHPDLSILAIHSYKRLAWLDIQDDAEAILTDDKFIAHFTKAPFEEETYNGLELVGYCPNYKHIRYRIFVKFFNEFM